MPERPNGCVCQLRMTIDDPNSVDESAQGKVMATRVHEARRAPRWILWVPILLVCAPLALSGLRREVRRWYAAASVEASLDGNLPSAIALARSGVAWDPDDLALRSTLIGLLIEQQEFDAALREANQSLDVARSQVEHRPDRNTTQNLAAALNHAAYARALAKTDLKQAKSLVDEALRLFTPNDESALAALEDTRGYIRYLAGELEAARQDLETALRRLEAGVKLQLAEVQLFGQIAIDERLQEYVRDQIQRGLGEVHYHRGLVYEKLGDLAKARKDFQRAEELGFEPPPADGQRVTRSTQSRAPSGMALAQRGVADHDQHDGDKRPVLHLHPLDRQAHVAHEGLNVVHHAQVYATSPLEFDEIGSGEGNCRSVSSMAN